MTSDAWNNTELATALKELGAVPNTPRGASVLSARQNSNGTPSSYAALSTGPNTTSKRTVDRSAGDRVFNAGFGGLSN
jgi:hypothetical protein